jgi:hypothetical protein
MESISPKNKRSSMRLMRQVMREHGGSLPAYGMQTHPRMFFEATRAPYELLFWTAKPAWSTRHTKGQRFLENAQRLRELATWYREFAEKAGSPIIWDARLRMAEDLDQEIARIEGPSAVA